MPSTPQSRTVPKKPPPDVYKRQEVVFVDGTHIKANANLKKQVKKDIPVAAKRYQEQLDEEIEADRAAHGKLSLIHI